MPHSDIKLVPSVARSIINMSFNRDLNIKKSLKMRGGIMLATYIKKFMIVLFDRDVKSLTCH